MDEADIAQREIERGLERAIAFRKPVPSITPIGSCHWCEEPFEEGSRKLFCDHKCAYRYDKRNEG